MPQSRPLPHPIAYEPAGRLVAMLQASGDRNSLLDATLALGRKAASYGETVLLLDANQGQLMTRGGIVYHKTLSDVASGQADLRDALYVTANEHFSVATLGGLPLDEALGTLAALSLDYDWVFVVPTEGCTPAHTRLAAAADTSLIAYDTQQDDFMRAYWMIEAVRRRQPKFDPLVLSTGIRVDAVETALMLSESVRDHLGAPPTYAGHETDTFLDVRLLGQMRDAVIKRAVAS